MQRYFIHLAYNGSQYHGWQMQPNAITVQEVLLEKLNIILPSKTTIMGCGRTDTGVHAKQFYAHFDIDKPLPKNVVFKLNAMLPPNIVIYDIKPVAIDLHCRFSANKRTYQYKISLKKNPFLSNMAWHCPYSLMIDTMNDACQYLLGKQNFKAFCKGAEKEEDNSFICEISTAKWELKDEELIFTISATRFLRNMVRAIVGTMVDVGRERISPAKLKEIIQSQDRQNSGMSVPACGLYLTEVEYSTSIL